MLFVFKLWEVNLGICSWVSVYRRVLLKNRASVAILVDKFGRKAMPEEDLVELKFILYDGSDVGPFRYSPASTVAMLKERIVAEWPKDKKIVPKAASDVKLISAGKILENSKTVAQCRMPFWEPPNGVITMHAVVQPSIAKAKTEKKVDETPKKTICSCSIL